MRSFCRCLLLASALWASAARSDSAGTTPSLLLQDLSTARALGMGNAYRALGLGAESVMGSPATMSLRRRYNMDVGGFWDSQTKEIYGGTGLVDSATNALAAGTAYQVVSDGHGSARRLSHLSSVGLATPIAESLHVGLAARYLTRAGPSHANAVTLDAGLALQLGGAFNVAFTGHDLVDTRHPELSRYYSLALGLTTPIVNLGLDARSSLAPLQWSQLSCSAGAELLLIPRVPLRGGYDWDGPNRRQGFSTGLGVGWDGGGIDLAYRHELSGPSRLFIATLHFDLGQPG